jgi:hypothetical protein
VLFIDHFESVDYFFQAHILDCEKQFPQIIWLIFVNTEISFKELMKFELLNIIGDLILQFLGYLLVFQKLNEFLIELPTSIPEALFDKLLHDLPVLRFLEIIGEDILQPLEELGLDFWEEVWEVEEQRVEDVRVEVGHVEADRQGGLEVDFRAVERGATARRFQQLQASG